MPPMRRKGVARRSLMNAKRMNRKSKYSKNRKNSKNAESTRAIVKMLTDNQLHVFQYPFSTRTKYPKIPDGKVDYSVGLNFAFSQNVEFDPAQPVYLILYGGHTTCACVFNIVNNANGQPTPNIISYGKFVQYMIPRQEIVPNNNVKLVYDQSGYASYRYVSAGMRITSDDGPWKVGGTWQACRLPCNKLNREFKFNFNMNHPDWNTVLPTHEFMTTIHGTRFELNPTFQSGMLKTIDDYEFRLKSQNLEHMFQGVPDYLELVSAEFDTNAGNAYGTEANNDGSDNQSKFDFTLDDNFDILVVKINTNSYSNNFSYQVTANIECVTNAVGQFGHFSTETINAADRFHRLKHKMMNDNRLPGSYNYNKRYQKAM